MKQQIWVAIGIFILMFGILMITSNNSSTTGNVIDEDQIKINGDDPISPVEETPTEEAKIEEVRPATIEAKIINYAYIPNTIEINIGDTVVWENRDSVAHTITSDDGEEMMSRELSQGQRYYHTFLEAGEYPYYCKPHPYMRAKVIVN